MQDLNEPATIAETDLQQLQENPTPLPEAHQPVEEADPAEVLRTAMASNYLQHCVNSAVADQTHGGAPLQVGMATAVSGLLLAIFRMSPDHFEDTLNAVSRGIGEVKIDQTHLSEMLMGVWAVGLSRNGQLNAALGRMKDIADYDRHQFFAQQVALATGKPAPAEVEPELAQPAPPVEPDNADEKPAEGARKVRSRAAKKRQGGEGDKTA